MMYIDRSCGSCRCRLERNGAGCRAHEVGDLGTFGRQDKGSFTDTSIGIPVLPSLRRSRMGRVSTILSAWYSVLGRAAERTK